MSEGRKGDKHPNYGKASPYLGRTHSEITKAKISEATAGVNNPFFGKTHSEESKKAMSLAHLGEKHPFFGKTHSEETILKLSLLNSLPVEVMDLKTNITINYTSIKKTAESFHCSESTVRSYIKSNKLYKGRYQIRKITEKKSGESDGEGKERIRFTQKVRIVSQVAISMVKAKLLEVYSLGASTIGR